MSKDVRKMIDDAFANGECVFVVRSRDKHSRSAIRGYLEDVDNDLKIPEEYTNDIRRILREFSDWQDQHPDKVRTPD